MRVCPPGWIAAAAWNRCLRVAPLRRIICANSRRSPEQWQAAKKPMQPEFLDKTTLASPYLRLLKNRINLRQIPFSDRASRLLLFQANHHFTIRLAERWFKLAGQLAAYRERPPLIDHLVFTD